MINQAVEKTISHKFEQITWVGDMKATTQQR
jgi:hypothetical protein